MTYFLYTWLAPFFIIDGIYLIIRSLLALKKEKRINTQKASSEHMWNVVSLIIGIGALILGLLFSLRIVAPP